MAELALPNFKVEANHGLIKKISGCDTAGQYFFFLSNQVKIKSWRSSAVELTMENRNHRTARHRVV